jgi:hypothetical protein
MNTPRDLLNRALGLMGQPGVTFFSPSEDIRPESVGGQKTADFFDAAIREVQQVFPWQELLRNAQLTSSSTDDWGRNVFSYASIEPEVLRPVGVAIARTLSKPDPFTNPQPTDSNIQYEIEGNAVHAFAPGPIRLSYVGYEPDTTKFGPALFRSCYHNLAALACYDVTGDTQRAQQLFVQYQQLVRPTAELTQLGYKTNQTQSPAETGMLPNMGGGEA